MPGCEFSHPLAHMPYDSLFNYTGAHCFFHRIPASLCAWDARCRFREKLFNFLFSPRCSSWHYSGCTMREGLRMPLWFSFIFLLIFITAQGPRVSWAPFVRSCMLSWPHSQTMAVQEHWGCALDKQPHQVFLILLSPLFSFPVSHLKSQSKFFPPLTWL